MTRVAVREGNTGILQLHYEDGRVERHVPDYDLTRARALLLEWQELEGQDGRRLKDSYWVEGINWFPAVVNYAHGRIFASYVKFRPLVERALDGSLEPVFETGGEFSSLWKLLRGLAPRRSAKNAIFDALVALNNRLTASRSRAPILFFRLTPDDFRTLRAKQALDDLGAQYVEAVSSERPLLFASLRRGGTHYFFGRTRGRNRFHRRYALDGLAVHKRVLFERAIEWLEGMMSTFVAEYRTHLRTLKKNRFQTFYGIDDTQIILPLLYACQDRGIYTVAHQHGAGYHPWHASYLMEHIEANHIRWFHKLIVWDEYWKDRLLTLSHLRPVDGVVVGCDLYAGQFGDGARAATRRDSARPRAILIPYEFLTNTYQVGRYVTKLLELGYDVSFKPRLDESLDDQLDAYCLAPEARVKLKIVKRLTPEVLDGIDIVAGTMTTLIYQLMPFGKAIWLLETDFPFYLQHLADQGYIHRIRYEDLDHLTDRHFAPSKRDLTPLATSKMMLETLARHVVTAPRTDTVGRVPALASVRSHRTMA